MIFYDLKDRSKFKLYGSYAIDEDGFNRLTNKDRIIMNRVNKRVSELSRNTSGISAKFTTDSKKISIKVKLEEIGHLPHMSSVGQSGFDLYVYNESEERYDFCGSTKAEANLDEYTFDLISFDTKKTRKFILNFPLYVSVKTAQLGFLTNSLLKPNEDINKDKIVFYGTSITQGACVSRPGMSYTNILSRKLNTEIINLGFSGNAMLEEEIGEIIGNIHDINLLFIDAHPNAGVDMTMKENLHKFIKSFRFKNPNVPIIIASRILYLADLYSLEKIELRKFYEQWLSDYVKKRNEYDKNIYFLNGNEVFGKDYSDYTVDGVHPTDLGSVKIANHYEKFIKKILNKN